MYRKHLNAYRPLSTRTGQYRRVGFYLPVQLCNEIQDLADQLDISMSAVAETALTSEKKKLLKLIDEKKENA